MYDMLPKMSGVGVDGSTITDRLNRQMIGGNTSGFLDTNAWLETHAFRPARGEDERPVYNVWIPVPTGLESAWSSFSSALEDRDDAMKWYLMWLKMFFLHTELSGTPGGNKLVQVAAEEGGVE